MIAWAVRHGLEDTWFCGSDLGGALPPVRGSSCPSWVGLPIPSFKGLWCATGLLQLGNAADPWSQKDIERRMYHRNVAALQRQAAANEMMTILPRSCRAALPKACRAKTPCRVSVVAVTVCAAGASGTWDIYSQIASRLKSLQARYSG